MMDGEDWLLRPVHAQMCKYESLLDGTLGLYDIMLMNEFLDVQYENQQRVERARPNGR